MSAGELVGWDRLRHGGLLLDPKRAGRFADEVRAPVGSHNERELRQMVAGLLETKADIAAFARFVLEEICGFTNGNGTWTRGSDVDSTWGRRGLGGELIKPRAMWKGIYGGLLPVFFDNESRLGVGRGKKAASQVVQWLRAGSERLAVLTNGKGWRLVFAALDADAWCEWDTDLWFEEGQLSPQVACLRILLSPKQWTPLTKGGVPPLAQAILDSRKGQAELSAALGERVREAVEILVQAHGDVLKRECADVEPSDIYRAAVRIVMRLVVVLFAESRDLLPRDNALYHGSYGLGGLLSELEKVGARGANRLARSHNAWPRVLALFRLVHAGSHHPALPVPEYGGELFAAGEASSYEGLQNALAVFETACFDLDLLSDRDVHRMLERLTRTRVKIRQGHATTWVSAPVDFSDLSSEYIGILYEGLLDFELKTAPAGDPVVFLGVGNQPALPLSRLEAMDDKALASLLEKMKDTSEAADDEENEGVAVSDGEEPDANEVTEETPVVVVEEADARQATRTRAETWARHAAEAGKMVRKPRGKITPEKQRRYEEDLGAKARQLVTQVVLAGEWYLVRWGGTRKGSGTFYTRPGLAVPTVRRTLRPLAYMPPTCADGGPNIDASAAEWTPRTPEEILSLTVCDPACGSGTFPVAALRFITDALYAAHYYHGRVMPADGDELRFKALLRRQVVERCIYGVDIDPLAVELCRLALWIETMDRTLPFSFLDHKIKAGNSLIGGWFDTYQYYPAMAWKQRDALKRSKEIKAFVKEELTPDLRDLLSGRRAMFEGPDEDPLTVHAEAREALIRIHELPEHESAERARLYRELRASAPYLALREAMDLWCACWFWPTERMEHAPLPTTIGDASEEMAWLAEEICARARMQFFHWELEFPDVFGPHRSGFDAMLGNPPWDIAKPSSKEFFSNIDPLYRSYGKQEALEYQTRYFSDPAVETSWERYNDDFKAQSNFIGNAANPFGDPEAGDSYSIAGGHKNRELHAEWRRRRAGAKGYAQVQHSYRHQGSADVNLYKLFLEQAHTLLCTGGRLGFIVPSGLYSDQGTGDLRRLFLDACSWEWLFGFENRDRVFDIDSRFKFNPVIVVKGGTTQSIRTAFMRRKLEDWEQAEGFVTPYTRAQVERFSPKSKAILEIQSARDLEILEKIYTNSVLLGDNGPKGWEITYAREFHMAEDSKLFPPRLKWEAEGYRPDEHSRWLKGAWRPIAELWAELDVDPSRVMPIDPECERRMVESGVQRTPWRVRCAQPPYDSLPIPRADIPVGIILSRDADAWLRRDGIADLALPLYQGVMISQLLANRAKWLSGAGSKAKWETHECFLRDFGPQYLIAERDAHDQIPTSLRPRFLLRSIARSTDERTVIGTAGAPFPSGHSLVTISSDRSLQAIWMFGALLSSFVIDWQMRRRLGGTNVSYAFLQDVALRSPAIVPLSLARAALGAACPSPLVSAVWIAMLGATPAPLAQRQMWALTPRHRLESRATLDAVAAAIFGLSAQDLRDILFDCDRPTAEVAAASGGDSKNPIGFWRVDKGKDPELRHTVLTLVAFGDMETRIRSVGGNRQKGIEAFLGQNDGEGWMLPETLRLADYGLGHDERAQHPQPVANRLGPRFYDWQLAQTAEESWRECEIHARNIGSLTPASTSASAPSATPAKAHAEASSLFQPDGDG